MRLLATGFLLVSPALQVVACGDGDSTRSGTADDGTTPDASTGTGGAPFIPSPTGGTPFVPVGGSGGTPQSGGAPAGGSGGGGGMSMGGAGGAADAGVVVGSDAGPCATANEQIIDPSVFPVCDQCAAARCVPNAAVPAAQLSQLADCDDANKCVPDSFVATGGNFLLASCTSLDGAEGRCVPDCLPAVASLAAYLPTEECASGEVCAPCYDPRTGEDSGACSASACDPGPTDPPVTFEKCCGDTGSCVPAGLVPENLQASLGPDTCADTTRLCAPDAFVDSSNQPIACRSVSDSEGRCIPECVPAVSDRASFLPKDVCGDGELCAPCYDPTTGESTGACEINGDVAVEDPVTFVECCDTLGVCVPTSAVPADQQGLLDANTCTGQGELCAPRDLTSSTFTPTTCSSVAGFEGRCLVSCLPDVAAQADRLPQDVCDAGYLCAPCYDPVTGENTGACDLNGDAPANPPTTFEKCCGGAGSCVPTNLVPTAQQSLLDGDTCSDSSLLCAPDKLTDTAFVPPTCASVGDFEGRCLPACLPDIRVQASRLPQDVCDAGDLCAPCYDPLTGDPTGACDLNGDAPVDPPGTFEACCGGLGSCVPPALVPTAQQSLLGNDTCTDGTALCAPTTLADPTATPAECNSISGYEGRCLPACLPDVAAQADRLPQDTCATGELCAPCYDPITGEDTGACTVNGDTPNGPAQTFPGCCSGNGVCVPDALVPTAQQSLLGTDTCSGQGVLCAPTALTDPTTKPASCTSFAPQNREGRCLADCIPQVQDRADQLRQESCGTGELCTPCYDPVIGGSTGACEINGDAPVDPDPQAFVECPATNIFCPICPPVDGRCVPSYIVPSSQAGLLPNPPPSPCVSGELCAPCVNPLDGVATGACPP